MSYVVVCAGQGTQHPQMLPWLDDRRPRVVSMQAQLGVADWRAAAADPAWAEGNRTAQTLVTGLALAAWDEIAPGLPVPAAVAGYSVGELAAYAIAGVLDAEAALALAVPRAEAMDRCAARQPGGLTAVSGLPRARIDALCAAHGLAVAIRNGAVNFILGGPTARLDDAEAEARAAGAERVTRLRVSVPSHTPAMAEAAREMATRLAPLPLRAPTVPLYTDARGRVFDAATAGAALAEQIATTVAWDDCLEGLRAHRPACLLELGPGQALARRWSQCFPDVPARSCDDFRSAAGARRWVLKQLGG